MNVRKFRPTATQIIAFGFAVIILTGALLLMLPAANRDGAPIPFLDALFTAASATCVTGLVVYDTWTQFTLFGQAVILLLIQIGGLGFMTVAVLISLALRKRIGLRERELMSESLSSLHIGGIIRLARRVLIGTAVLEGVGALLLALRFCPRFGFWRGVWYGIFHAVSAFCNAGFDLMGCLEPYSSLTCFRGDPLVNAVILLLIVSGGIGFVVWGDLWDNRGHVRRYLLHTKIMLAGTAILILGGAALFFFMEADASMAGLSIPERVLASLFQAVTPRTAGFNTIDVASLSGGGSLLTILLMFIGAGPGSTGGGIKISTAAVMLLSVGAYARGREDINVFHRRIDPALSRRAFCTATFYFLLTLLAALVILQAQSLPVRDVLLEVFSAIGTVGLSTGITRSLNALSKLVVILLMYSGRVGSLTVILSVSERQGRRTLVNPTEKIIVG